MTPQQQGDPDPGLRLTWLGHSTVVIDLGGQRLLTDPLLLRHNPPLRRRGPRPARSAWEGTDAVLLSHLHHDHAELHSLRLLPDVPVLTGGRNARWARNRGLDGRTPEDWTHVGPVRVRLVRADHHRRPMPHRPGDAHGHLVRSATTSVWVAGDTSLYGGIGRLPELAGVDRIDVAVVPIGGWAPRRTADHMWPAEAAAACALTRARYALPVHWGTLSPPVVGSIGAWFERPIGEFLEHVADAAPDCEVVRLRLGGSWSLPVAGG